MGGNTDMDSKESGLTCEAFPVVYYDLRLINIGYLY